MGKVYLVGAGCGDAGLITVKAQKLLQCCEVVIYDSLVPEEVLQWMGPECEKIYVGKRYGRHAMKQQEINQLLVEKAREGKLVVRLKGGDPYVFGRGGEEFLAMKEAGICCEEVPGISSAFAVPAAAGIPVTHRGLSGSVTVVTGTAAGEDGSPRLRLDFEALAKLQGTLVILMGMHHLEGIAEGLICAGMCPDTPAAVIMEGATRRQRSLRTRLARLAEEAVEQGFASPAVIVIGEVAGLELLSGKKEPGTGAEPELWLGKKKPEAEAGLEMVSRDAEPEAELRLEQVSGNTGMDTVPGSGNLPGEAVAGVGKRFPLRGITVGVTGTPRFVEKLSRVLTAQGASVWDMGFMEVQPVEESLPDFADFSWLVFTSPNGARIFLDKMKQEKRDLRSLRGNQIAVIGPGTAEVLSGAGIYADYMPEIYDTVHLAEGLTDRILAERPAEGVALAEKGRDRNPAMFLRAQSGSAALPEIFSRKGIAFVDYPLYQLGICRQKRMLALEKCPDYVVFGSAMGVQAYFEGLEEQGTGEKEADVRQSGRNTCVGDISATRYLSMGDMCSRELAKHTDRAFLVAEEASMEGIVSCLCRQAALGNRDGRE